MVTCAEYNRLASDLEDILGRLTTMTGKHLEGFKAGDFPASRRLDKELELTMGEKERAIGALRQHMVEHKCQSIEPI